MSDGVDITQRRPRDHVAFTTVVLVVLVIAILSASLFVSVILAYRSSGEAQKLRVQVSAGDAVVECRSRFTNEDARIGGLRIDGFLDRELARASGDSELVALYDTYLLALSPARLRASVERTLSPQVCQQNPASQPTSIPLPDIPQ